MIDTRSQAAYRSAHIEGSLNIPQETLEEMLDHGLPFPTGNQILFVCPVGEVSQRFVVRLRTMGVIAFGLEQGITGWRDAGLPLERHRSSAPTP